MTAPLLSVVLPVYNVAPYLSACLDSLSRQTLRPDEIIAVDDGSTDECPLILAEYAARMPNVRVITQANGGLSVARNTGLEAARGKYLAFVDSDDYVEPDMYERLVAMAENDHLDMALCNAEYDFEGRQPPTNVYDRTAASDVTSGPAWMKAMLSKGRMLHMVWMHLYRRDFIETHGFRFVPGLIHEDVVWTTAALLAAQRIRYDDTPLYHYRIPIRRFTPERREQRFEAIIDSSIFNARAMSKMADGIVDPELSSLLDAEWVEGAFSVFHKAERLSPSRRRCRYRQFRREGFFALLWSHAGTWRQRRRVVRNYLKSLFAGR